MTLRIANAGRSVFDRPGAARRIAEDSEIDCLTFAYLSGGTAIHRAAAARLAFERRRDAGPGFVSQLLDVLRDLTPALYLQPQLKLLSTAGAFHPAGCAERAAAILTEQGSGEIPLAVVAGGDLFDRLEELISQGCTLANANSAEPLAALTRPIVAAYARPGAQGPAEAWKQGARVVLTGMLAPEALTIAAAAAAHSWEWSAWDPLAGAATLGHVLNAGGRLCRDPKGSIPSYPHSLIAEIDGDGGSSLRLLPRSEGSLDPRRVCDETRRLVRERNPSQPSQLLTPDVVVALDTLKAEPDRGGGVLLHGARGAPPGNVLDVEILYHAGYMASALFAKAEADAMIDIPSLEEVIGERLTATGGRADGEAAAVTVEKAAAGVVRIAATHVREQPLRAFAAEMANWAELGCSGWIPLSPLPIAIEPRIETWPTSIPRDMAESTVDCRPARDWL